MGIYRVDGKRNGSVPVLPAAYHLRIGDVRILRLMKAPGPVLICRLFRAVFRLPAQGFRVYVKKCRDDRLKFLLGYPMNTFLPGTSLLPIGVGPAPQDGIEPVEHIVKVQVPILLPAPATEEHIVPLIAYRQQIFPVQLPAAFLQGQHAQGRMLLCSAESHHKVLRQQALSRKNQIALRGIFPKVRRVAHRASLLQDSLPIVLVITSDYSYVAALGLQIEFPEAHPHGYHNRELPAFLLLHRPDELQYLLRPRHVHLVIAGGGSVAVFTKPIHHAPYSLYTSQSARLGRLGINVTADFRYALCVRAFVPAVLTGNPCPAVLTLQGHRFDIFSPGQLVAHLILCPVTAAGQQKRRYTDSPEQAAPFSHPILLLRRAMLKKSCPAWFLSKRDCHFSLRVCIILPVPHVD